MTELSEVLGMFWINRTMCDVLEEMRKLNDKLNSGVVSQHKKTMAYLIEEVQSMGNRMEASIQNKGDIESIDEEIREKRKELKKLKQEIKEAKDGLEG